MFLLFPPRPGHKVKTAKVPPLEGQIMAKGAGLADGLTFVFVPYYDPIKAILKPLRNPIRTLLKPY
jgi:hypothetical protein